MTEALKGVVAEIVSDDFDRVLVNGDVAFRSGEAGDYVRFREVIQPVVARGIPIHLTLGNHDHREHFLSGLVPPHEKAMGTKVVCSRIDRGTHWILLDSLDKVNGIPGTLGAAQLDWMARRLDAHQDAPAIICLHHNPEVSLSGLTDTRAFLQSVRPRRQVKAVIFGHTHEFHVSSDEGLHLINLPAVGYRFRSDKSRGWLSASISRNEMSITFNCLDKSESSCGGAQVLTWRSDKSS